MSRTRFPLAVLLAALVGLASASGAAPTLLKGKPRTDPARVPALVEALRSDPDEKKRKAAADELGRADARQMPEVVTALVAALQKDASASVRLEAAESIGQLGSVFPMAGVALETAASGDASTLVRLAAKKSLWEYHLNGYRSPKGTDGLAAQTVEPPIASPASPRPASAAIPVVPPAVPLIPQLPVAAPTNLGMLAPVSPPNGPRLLRPTALIELLFGTRPLPPVANGGPPIPNVTAEPPIAKRPAVSIPPLPLPTPLVPPPTVAVKPEQVTPVKPDYVPTLPPLRAELPSVVTPPDATPPAPTPTIPRIPATLPTLP